MSTSREQRVTEAFVSLASSLSRGFDAVDLLDDLTEYCAELLDVSAVGILLADGLGVLHVLAASSQATRDLELFQIQRDEGPCRDCYYAGVPISVPDLAAETARWPVFAPRALGAGFLSVHAVPLHLRANSLGAMNLFGSTVGPLAPPDLVLAQALADVASVALINDRAAADRSLVVEQMHVALNSRVVLEQAKGVVAFVAHLDTAEALQVLRRYARDRNLRLSDVAQSVVNLELSTRVLLAHQ